MIGRGRCQFALVGAFLLTAVRYWVGVFPLVRRELRHWHRQATQISDPLLRHHALETQRAELGNLEGAAAFAVLAPRARRAEVVRATVAFQIAYDYVDSLAEQPSENPTANGYQLHLALLSAVSAPVAPIDYYRHGSGGFDNGYIEKLTEVCRETLRTLPSYEAVAESTLRAVERMVIYQCLNHGENARRSDHRELARWAGAITPAGMELRWWETAAGAASSLNVFPLFAAAGRPALDAGDTTAIERAYFPWIGALHVLLDSLVDWDLDVATGDHSLVDHYDSIEEAAARMRSIAAVAIERTATVPQATQHALILAAMTSFYLSAPGARTSSASPVAREVLQAMGAMARPTMAVLSARRAAARSI